jgi:hypothetical protein
MFESTAMIGIPLLPRLLRRHNDIGSHNPVITTGGYLLLSLFLILKQKGFWVIRMLK